MFRFLLALTTAAALLVLGFRPATADVFYPDRDNQLHGYSSERDTNLGKRTAARSAKFYQENYICDWDTVAIKDWITANPLGVGQSYNVEFFVYLLDGWPDTPVGVEVWTLNLHDDWAEGDSASDDNFQWTEGTFAATYNYAQHKYELVGDPAVAVTTADSVDWAAEDGTVTEFYSLTPNYTNTATLDGSSAEHGSYISAVLDEAVVNDLLDNANNFGLWLHSPDSNNKRIFTIDDGGTGTDRDPYLAITVVPEPATLLFLLAGLPLIARRRRSA